MQSLTQLLIQSMIFKLILKTKIFHNNNQNMIWQFHDITRQVLHLTNHFLKFVF